MHAGCIKNTVTWRRCYIFRSYDVDVNQNTISKDIFSQAVKRADGMLRQLLD